MKKILVFLLTTLALLGGVSSANAHGWRGGYGGGYGGGWHGGWAPFAVGVVTGAVVANAHFRQAPVYYVPPTYYYPQQQSAAYCPENGLYYPQTQACPSGWERVPN